MGEFESKVTSDPRMQALFDLLNVDTCDANALFDVMDMDKSGSIDLVEFIDRCPKLRGVAKALDLHVFEEEAIDHFRCLDARLVALQRTMTGLCSLTAERAQRPPGPWN